jgi:hypothetical protein
MTFQILFSFKLWIIDGMRDFYKCKATNDGGVDGWMMPRWWENEPQTDYNICDRSRNSLSEFQFAFIAGDAKATNKKVLLLANLPSIVATVQIGWIISINVDYPRPTWLLGRQSVSQSLIRAIVCLRRTNFCLDEDRTFQSRFDI